MSGGDCVPLKVHEEFKQRTGIEITKQCGASEVGPFAVNAGVHELAEAYPEFEIHIRDAIDSTTKLKRFALRKDTVFCNGCENA